MPRKKAVVSWLAKLTPAQVRWARKLHREGLAQSRIAERLKVSQSTVSNLIRGITYRRVA
jgi:predicted transcriptional regulator